MNNNIEPGKLLIAEPYMWDPNFKRSVILLCDHHEEGTLGFVINKEIDLKVSDLLPNFPEFDAKVYFGGPMQTDTLYVVHNVGDLIEGGELITKGVWWGGDFQQLSFLAETKLITSDNVRFFVGYTGWSPGQLRDEIDSKSWLMEDADPNYIFKYNQEELWQMILRHKGNHYSVLADIPKETFWN